VLPSKHNKLAEFIRMLEVQGEPVAEFEERI